MKGKQAGIIEQFKTKYPRISSIDKEDIGSFFISLSEKDAETLWIKIRQEYPEDFPTLYKIREFANTHGIKPEIDFKDNGRPAQICNHCGQMFANKHDRIQGVIYCPRCGTMTDATVKRDVPDKYITFAQDNCWRCPLFRSDEKTRGLYGPSCPEYGLNKNTPQCGSCRCQKCCRTFISVIKDDTPEDRKVIHEKKDWRKILEENKETHDRVKNADYSCVTNIAKKGDEK